MFLPHALEQMQTRCSAFTTGAGLEIMGFLLGEYWLTTFLHVDSGVGSGGLSYDL